MLETFQKELCTVLRFIRKNDLCYQNLPVFSSIMEQQSFRNQLREIDNEVLLFFMSKSKSRYSWRSVSQSVCQGIEPTLRLVTRYHFLFEGCFLKVVVSVGCTLWREAGSVICHSQFVVIYQYLHQAFTLHVVEQSFPGDNSALLKYNLLDFCVWKLRSISWYNEMNYRVTQFLDAIFLHFSITD
jgi:hypothetical protein